MIRYKRLISPLVVLLLGAAFVGNQLLAPEAQAQSVAKSGDNITQVEDVNGIFFGTGSVVQVDSDVNGDVYAVGQTIAVTGEVSGDVLAAGQAITLSGNIEGDVRVMAQTVTVTGEIKGSLSVAAQTVVIGHSAKVDRDAVFAAQSATINGSVGRDIQGAVERLSISGSVGRNVNYVSDSDISQASSAAIGGEVTRTDVPKSSSQTSSTGDRLAFFLYIVLAGSFTLMILTLILPRWLVTTTNHGLPRPWRAILAGLIIVALLPVIVALLMMTIIGIPLAILIIFAYITLIGISFILTSFYVGRLVLRDKNGAVIQGITGAIIYVILLSIPIINILTWILGSLLGIGLVALDIQKRLVSKPTVTAKLVKKQTKA